MKRSDWGIKKETGRRKRTASIRWSTGRMSSGNLPPEAVENSLCNSFDKSLTVKANLSAPTGSFLPLRPAAGCRSDRQGAAAPTGRGLPLRPAGGCRSNWKGASNSIGRGLPIQLEGSFQFSWKGASNSVGTVSPYSKRFTVSGYDIKSNEQLCSFGELKLAQSLLRGKSPKQSGELCRSKTFIPTAANSPLGGGAQDAVNLLTEID